MNTTLPRLGSRVRISFLAHLKPPIPGGFFVVWQGLQRVGNVGSLAGKTAVHSVSLMQRTEIPKSAG